MCRRDPHGQLRSRERLFRARPSRLQGRRNHLSQVAQDQYDARPMLPPGMPLEPGDLVFFGGGPDSIDHIRLVVSLGVMVNAPSTGDDIREHTFPTTVGASFRNMIYAGTTRPSASQSRDLTHLSKPQPRAPEPQANRTSSWHSGRPRLGDVRTNPFQVGGW